MVVTDFSEKYAMYENFQIWEILNLDDFFQSHTMLFEIFKKEYGFPFEKRNESGKKFEDTDIEIVSKLMNYFNDKQFFIFSLNDNNHKELITLQERKIINFGIDICAIEPSKLYVLDMDKTSN